MDIRRQMLLKKVLAVELLLILAALGATLKSRHFPEIIQKVWI